MGFNGFKATEPLRGDSLLFTSRSPGVRITQLIDWDGWKAEITSGHPVVLDPGLWIGNPAPYPLGHFQTIIFKKTEIFHTSYGLPAPKIYQNVFTHTKESPKTRCFQCTVILIFTSNHICTLQKNMKS